MNITKSEMLGQYAALKRTLQAFDDKKGEIEAFFGRNRFAGLIFIGSGSSYCVAKSIAIAARLCFNIPATAVSAGDLLVNAGRYAKTLKDTVLITLSRSGGTSEIIYSVKKVKKDTEVPCVSVCLRENSEMAGLADFNIELPWAFDESVCQTRSVTNLYAAGMALIAALAGKTAAAGDLASGICAPGVAEASVPVKGISAPRAAAAGDPAAPDEPMAGKTAAADEQAEGASAADTPDADISPNADSAIRTSAPRAAVAVDPAAPDEPNDAPAADSESLFRALVNAADYGDEFIRRNLDMFQAIAALGWNKVVTLADAELEGIAEEAALVFKEIALLPANYHHLMDVRHGPIVLIDDKTLVIAAVSPAESSYQNDLLKDLKRKGATVVVMYADNRGAVCAENRGEVFADGHDGTCGDAKCGDSADNRGAMCADYRVEIPAFGEFAAYGIPYIFVAQAIAYYKAEIAGINPDLPKGLDACIILK